MTMNDVVYARPLHTSSTVEGIVTAAPQMHAFFETLRKVSRTDASVLIRGESGTGKELVAHAIHRLSPRRSGPFRAINCATLNGNLLESELFGHVRGAFTGAVKDRPGLFASAHGGTVFLDEIAELPLELQARLLRVLQERSFVPVGGTEPVSVNVRVLSATHRSLRDEVDHGRFREDLMYRLRVVPVFLPRLVDREGDIELLTWHFIHEFNQQGFRTVTAVAADAMQALLRYTWPGNIRELRNNLEYAYAVGEGTTLRLEELTPELRDERPADAHRHLYMPGSHPERARIVEALRAANGRKQVAAAALGWSRSTLWRKMREHSVDERN
jgi:two-component system, NtrC family, response regulator AtoC